MILVSDYPPIELIGISGRLAIGSILLASGIMKVVRPPNLEPLINAVGVPEIGSRNLIARLLASIEVAIGLWLFTGWLIKYALVSVILLFVAFIFVQAAAVQGGYKGGCACFGANENGQIGITQRVRNIVFLLVSSFSFVSSFKSTGTEFPIWALPRLVFVLAAIMLGAGTAVYLLSTEIESLVRRPSS
ncbi:MAG TPA: MauE/DoxX family redox-associated membrane protein [Pyrinomonadaceae bacterium]|nr:MauE/DoxX family redox-associated membrane protein [Pyrinomonadaceae bacterium]